MARGARPPAGAVRASAAVLGTVVATLVLGACGGVGQPASYDATGIDGLEVPTPSPDPADFVDEVDNSWFPLGPGRSWRYVVAEGGERVGSVRVDVLRRTVVAGVDATAVLTTTTIAGDVDAVTRYYAQDEAGNVWLVGADGDGTGWRAGEGGAEGGLVLPAEPRVGDGWVSARVPGEADRVVRVEPTGVVTRGGTEGTAVWTSEDDGAGTRTRHVYVADVGLVESEVLESPNGAGRTTTLVSPAG